MRRNHLRAYLLMSILGGIGLLWFISVQSESTLVMWLNELFVQRCWDSWMFLIIALAVPIITGFGMSNHYQGLSGILLAPIAAAVVTFLVYLLVGLAMVIWMDIEICGGIALFLLVSIISGPVIYIIRFSISRA